MHIGSTSLIGPVTQALGEIIETAECAVELPQSQKQVVSLSRNVIFGY
jgi:hypothetical protein